MYASKSPYPVSVLDTSRRQINVDFSSLTFLRQILSFPRYLSSSCVRSDSRANDVKSHRMRLDATTPSKLAQFEERQTSDALQRLHSRCVTAEDVDDVNGN